MDTNSTELLKHLLSTLPEALVLNNDELNTLLLEVWGEPNFLLKRTLFIAETLDLLDYAGLSDLLTTVQSYYTAFVLFDDIIDQDKESSLATKQGIAIATNLALNFFTFAYINLLKFCQTYKISDKKAFYLQYNTFEAIFLMSKTNSTYLKEIQVIVNEEEYISRLVATSGAFFGMVCTMLATVANLPENQAEKLNLFGQYLGLISQLLNDLASCTAKNLQRNSLIQSIVTLPVIYANETLDSATKSRLNQLWSISQKTENETQELYKIIQQAGAFHLTVMKLATLINGMNELLELSNPIDAQLSELVVDFQKSLSKYI